MHRTFLFALRTVLPRLSLLLCFFWSNATGDDMTSTFAIGGARIDISIDSANGRISQGDLMRWVKSAAESVTAYYGRFPLPHVFLRIEGSGRRGVHGGLTSERDGGTISIHVGSGTTPTDFADDWRLTHEMLHLAFPSVDDRHHWMEEGISTYVEPIARIRAGHLTARRMWADLVRDLPQGLPEDGDRGLDHTHTWGRTYWGGALFCLLADIEIRRQTNQRKGLEDALRAILDAGGDIRNSWKLEKAIEIGDRATGTRVLAKLYGQMKDQPLNTDLDALWKQLGLIREGNSIRFDDAAPLAAVRRAITDAAETKSSSARAARPLAIFAGRTAGRM